MKSTVIFDLDGTIADPAVGVARSINHALLQLGRDARPETTLHKYVGPHLKTTFSELLETQDEAMISRAIDFCRERYISEGYQENHLYDGMTAILAELRASGMTLCIATARRQDIANQVLSYLGVDSFFTQVHGCGLSRAKSELLSDILSDDALLEHPMVMIGDRDSDFEAAAAVGMPSIGVRWGYGNKDELAMATAVADMPIDLPKLIELNAQQINPDYCSIRANV